MVDISFDKIVLKLGGKFESSQLLKTATEIQKRNVFRETFEVQKMNRSNFMPMGVDLGVCRIIIKVKS